MKVILLVTIAFLTLFSSSLLAQNSSIPTKVDSLFLDDLIDKAENLFEEMEFDSAVVFFNQAYDYAIKVNHKEEAFYSKSRVAYIYSTQAKYDDAISTYEAALEYAIKDQNLIWQAEVYNSLGLMNNRISNNNEAINLLLKGLKIGEELNNPNLLKEAYNLLANVNASLENIEESNNYQLKALDIAIQQNDSMYIGISYNNLADSYTNEENYSKALEYLEMAEKIQKEMTPMDEVGLGYTYTMMAFIYKNEGDLKKADALFEKGLKIREETGTQYEKAMTYNDLAELNLEKRSFQTAKNFLKKSLDISLDAKILELIPTSYLLLAEIDSLDGDYKSAYLNMQNYVFYEGKLKSEENSREANLSQMKFEVEKRDALKAAEQEKKDAIAAEELRIQNLQRNVFIAGFSIMLIFAGVFLVQRNRISKEKDRSENLLLNILPYETAQELKEKGYADAQPIAEVSVLFTDFKGFTQLSEKLTPSQLVAAIHECFSEFDKIVGKYGVEKIKTIGDAYMAAGGLPTPNKTHALDVVKAAHDIQVFMVKLAEEKKAKGEPFFEIRIGVHTGPVVAGIVGIKKFQYDIWGDTVNTASRMESSGAVGRVNISEFTHDLVQDQVICEYRGEIEAKGKGKVKMYFVNDII